MRAARRAGPLIEEDALQRLVLPFLSEDGLLAAGGTIRVVNGSDVDRGRVTRARAPRTALPGIQVVEYLRAFLFGRLGWNRLGGNLIISGAFGLFRREAVVDAGGYLHDSVGEDMELVVRLRRHGYEHDGPRQVAFIPDPVAWIEVPEELARARAAARAVAPRPLRCPLAPPSHAAQPPLRHRGPRGLPLLSVHRTPRPRHRDPRPHRPGDGPAHRRPRLQVRIPLLPGPYAIGIVLSMFTLLLEELSFRRYTGFGNRVRLVTWAFLENFGYRQITAVWRGRGAIRFLRGRTEWGAMVRKGFEPT